jgi:uncharacterized protein (TIGR00251 family)
MTLPIRTRLAISNGEREVTAPSHELPATSPGAGGILVGVRVSPSAPRTALRGVYGDRLKVAVSAPPEDNRANRELVDALAKWLGLRRDDVSIDAGHGSRDKVVAFSGIEEPELRSRLVALLRGDLPAKGE